MNAKERIGKELLSYERTCDLLEIREDSRSRLLRVPKDKKLKSRPANLSFKRELKPRKQTGVTRESHA